MQLENTVYALHITETYDDFEAEWFLHEAINVTAKHYVLECIFMREVSRFLFLFGWILMPPNGVWLLWKCKLKLKLK